MAYRKRLKFLAKIVEIDRINPVLKQGGSNEFGCRCDFRKRRSDTLGASPPSYAGRETRLLYLSPSILTEGLRRPRTRRAKTCHLHYRAFFLGAPCRRTDVAERQHRDAHERARRNSPLLRSRIFRDSLPHVFFLPWNQKSDSSSETLEVAPCLRTPHDRNRIPSSCFSFRLARNTAPRFIRSRRFL